MILNSYSLLTSCSFTIKTEANRKASLQFLILTSTVIDLLLLRQALRQTSLKLFVIQTTNRAVSRISNTGGTIWPFLIIGEYWSQSLSIVVKALVQRRTGERRRKPASKKFRPPHFIHSSSISEPPPHLLLLRPLTSFPASTACFCCSFKCLSLELLINNLIRALGNN